MTTGPASGELEQRLGATLSAGAWLACAVIAGGMTWVFFNAASGWMIVMVGIAIIILLPIVRVAMMLAAFAKARDFRFVAVAAGVLLVIGLGVLAGLHPANRP
jgi:uncharacterized membrane protein